MDLNATMGALQPGTSYNVYLYAAPLGSFPAVPHSNFNQQSGKAQEQWTLTWDDSSDTWDVASSTASSSTWDASCASGKCTLTVDESNVAGEGVTPVTSDKSYAFRAVPN